MSDQPTSPPESTPTVQSTTACQKDMLIAQQAKTIAHQVATIARLEAKLADLTREVQTLRRKLFGQKTEKKPLLPAEGQTVLGLDGEGEPEYADEEDKDGVEPAPPPVIEAKKRGGSKKGRKIRALNLPENFPTETRRIVPPEVEANPEKYREIGEPERREILDREHAQWRRIIIERPKFVSKEEPQAAPIIAPPEPEMIPGGYLSTTLLVGLIIFKFAYHHPLYRFARMAKAEAGIDLSESTLCQAVRRCSDMVAAVVQQMAYEMWQEGYVQLDLSPVRCLGNEGDKAGADGSFLGQMWFTGAPHGDLIVTWDKSKEALVLHRIIPGWYHGYIQVDGGSESESFFTGGPASQLPDGQPSPYDLSAIIGLGCMAHGRRKFYDSGRDGCPDSLHLLELIGKLYAIEKEARDALMKPADRKILRQARAPAILAEIKKELDRLNPKINSSVLPKSRLGQAVRYMLNRWDRLLVYIDDGRLEIDNNLIENSIRPCALGRKNYLFIGHVNAGQRAANFYSLIGSCERRGLCATAYLTWLFERLPRTPMTSANMSSLTPAAYAKLMATAADAEAPDPAAVPSTMIEPSGKLAVA